MVEQYVAEIFNVQADLVEKSREPYLDHWAIQAVQRPRLEVQEPWLERDDLLLAADWLEFRAADDGGALLGAKLMLDRLLCEGLAWSCEDGGDLLAALCPGPALEEALDPRDGQGEALLRRSGPFDPAGRSMDLFSASVSSGDTLRGVERRWQGSGTAALVRVLSLP